MEHRRPEEPASPPGHPSTPRLIGLAAVFYGVMAGLAVTWRQWGSSESVLFTGPAREALGVAWARDAGAGLLAGALVIVLSRELTRRTEFGDRLARVLAQALGPLGNGAILSLALLSGVAEEFFFRGALQVEVGYLPACLLFGLAHFVPRREWLPWTGFALAAGVLLGWLFEATGNLLAPILAHVLVNAVNLWTLKRDYPSNVGVDQADSSS